jgi:hypothetical protein
MRKLMIALAVTGLAALAAVPASAGTVLVNSDIAASEVWTSNNEYILDKVIYVMNGATLTIEPGTVIRGVGESAPGANDPGTLVITRGSKIFAMGTASDPIVMTNLDDDNIGTNPGTFPYDSRENAQSVTGTWGGLILLGDTYVSNNTTTGPDATRQVQIEGLTAVGNLGFYGNGGDDDDDSGVINYLSLRYGGFNLSANNEINGLTLGAVGRSTEIDYVEVFQNKDDCFEFFGGTVGLKHSACVAAGDDGVDYDEGFRGQIQFVLEIQGTPGSDKSDKGGEHDGGNGGDSSRPFTTPVIYNATYVGLGQKSFTNNETNTGMHFRDNAGGYYYNSAFLDFGGAPLLIEGRPSGANTSGQRATTAISALPDAIATYHPVLATLNPATPQLDLQDDTFWCFDDPSLPVTGIPADFNGADASTGQPAGIAQLFGGDSGKDHMDPGIFTDAARDNDLLACATPLPIRGLGREVMGAPTVPDPVDQIDPRLAPGGALEMTDQAVPANGFFAPTPYRGAFRSGHNWSQDWTNLSRLGYFATCAGGASAAVPDEPRSIDVGGPLGNDTRRVTWEKPAGYVGDETFDLIRSTDPSDFSAGACVASGDTSASATDGTLPALGQTFFYVARASNSCGDGTVGAGSNGTERVAAACP